MAEKDVPLQSLTIYLLREEVREPAQALRAMDRLTHLDAGDGTLYIQTRRPMPPRWGRFFTGYIDLAQLGRVSTTSAVFLVAVRGRLFALTFGQGRHLLVPGCWEERFGLKVSLNCIEENHLRSIDKRTFDAISLQTRTQASREGTPTDFGIDIEQDLLRAVTGTPSDDRLGAKLSGMDSLHALVRVDLSLLTDLLGIYLDKFHDRTYQTVFPWVDHIAEVTNQQTRSALDLGLIEKINARTFDRCWLAVPDIVDWARVSGFRYGSGRRAPEYHDLHFPDFLSSLPNGTVTDEILRRRHAVCFNHDGMEIDEWPIYQCIYCEQEVGEESFLLSGAKWYRVNRDFVTGVNNAFRSLTPFDRALPEYDDDSEALYCARVATDDPDTYALMDRKIVQIGGPYQKIEFCDLYSASKDVIHIKRYGGSSVLSHLFSQGLVSGETFRSDADFRRDVNQLLPESYRLNDIEHPPNSSDFQVVFAIVSDAPGDLTIPFFSRISIKHAARRLQAFGFRVAVAKIDVAEQRARLQRFQ